MITLLWWAFFSVALACEPAALEEVAYTGRLTDENKQCLEASIEAGTPEEKAQWSFYLIINASVAKNVPESGELMRRHLTQFHTRDAEIAYLYATWLKDRGFQNSEEIVRWSKVALDGRVRWLNKRRNYHTMVKTLYDMLNEAAMVSAIQSEQEYRANPSDEKLQTLEFRRRRARYWLIVSAPCLHDNECEPKYSVEVEGAAPCDDMLLMEEKANKGQLSDDERSCLRARYRRTNKQKIIDILLIDANKDRSGHRWNRLLAWHFDLTGSDDATLTSGAAAFLAKTGKDEEAMRYADLALADTENLRAAKGTVFQLYALRLDLARKALTAAEAAAKAEGATEKAFLAAQTAKGRVRAYEVEQAAYCKAEPKECPRGWDKQ